MTGVDCPVCLQQAAFCTCAASALASLYARAGRRWSDAYVGLPYAEADCGELAARVQREVFGRDVSIPRERACGLRGLTRQIDSLIDDFAERTEAPTEGDGVLLVMGSKDRLWHIGVYCVIAGVPYTLHAVRKAKQTVRTRQCDLAQLGMKIEGYYRWI